MATHYIPSSNLLFCDIRYNYDETYEVIMRKHKWILVLHIVYSGTPLSGHPSTTDTCDITDNSECPDCISIDFNTFKPP